MSPDVFPLVSNDSKLHISENVVMRLLWCVFVREKSNFSYVDKTNIQLSEEELRSVLDFISKYNGVYINEYKSLAKEINSNYKHYCPLSVIFNCLSLKALDNLCLEVEIISEKIKSAKNYDFNCLALEFVEKEYFYLKSFILRQSKKDRGFLWNVFQAVKVDAKLFEKVAQDIFPDFFQDAVVADLQESERSDLFWALYNANDYESIIGKLNKYQSTYLLTIDDINWNARFSHEEVKLILSLPIQDSIRDKIQKAYTAKDFSIKYFFKMPSYSELSGLKDISNLIVSGAFRSKNSPFQALPQEINEYFLKFLLNERGEVGVEKLIYNADQDLRASLSSYNKYVGSDKKNKGSFYGLLASGFVWLRSNMFEEHFWSIMVALYVMFLLVLFDALSFLWLPLFMVTAVSIISFYIRRNPELQKRQASLSIKQNFVWFSISLYAITLVFMFHVMPLFILPIIVITTSLFSSFPVWQSFVSYYKSFEFRTHVSEYDKGLSKDFKEFVANSQSLSLGYVKNNAFKFDSKESFMRFNEFLSRNRGEAVVSRFYDVVGNVEAQSLESILQKASNLPFEDLEELSDMLGKYDESLARNILVGYSP